MVSLGSQFIMGRCNHEEADIRIVVRVNHVLEGGAESILVRTVDTDFIVILVGKLYDLLAWNERAQVWVAFGTGRQLSIININRICSTLEKCKSRALPVFHTFTGCDCTSQFFGIGKVTACQAWKVNSQVTPALEHISRHPFEPLSITSENFKSLDHNSVRQVKFPGVGQ